MTDDANGFGELDPDGKEECGIRAGYLGFGCKGKVP